MTVDDQSESPHAPAKDDQSPATGKTLEDGRCHQCGYVLKGLPRRGKCPECGEKYEVELVIPQPLPGAFSVCLRFLWPLILVMVMSVLLPVVNASQDYGPVALWMIGSAGVLLLFPINSIIQASVLSRHPASQQVKRYPMGCRLSMAVWIMFLVTFFLPLLTFGGCLLFI